MSPSLAAGQVSRAPCELVLSSTAAELQRGDAGQNNHHGNVAEKIDLIACEENADDKRDVRKAKDHIFHPYQKRYCFKRPLDVAS